MHRKAATDPGKELHLYSRIGMYNEGLLSFFNVNGTDYDLSAVGLEIGVKKNRGEEDFITLTEGSGITITGNDVAFVFTEDQSDLFTQRPYYWELRRTISGNQKVWLNGDHDWHNGRFDSFNNNGESIVIDDNGTPVEITINDGGGGSADLSGTWRHCGDFDASGGSLPTTGGTGTGGDFEAFNTLLVTTSGIIDGNPLPVGTILVALQDEPTNDFSVTGWKYF